MLNEQAADYRKNFFLQFWLPLGINYSTQYIAWHSALQYITQTYISKFSKLYAHFKYTVTTLWVGTTMVVYLTENRTVDITPRLRFFLGLTLLLQFLDAKNPSYSTVTM